MKKIVFCALAAFAEHFAFGGYAWYSEEINAILAKMPEKYYTKVNATLYGFFYGEIWSPPYAVYDSTTGKFHITNGSSFNVTSYATLNDYGKYDTGKSLDSFFENCGQYVKDEFGSEYTIYDDNMASFYAEYEASNMTAAREAFNSLEAAFTMWKQDVISQTTDIGADVSKIAELTKEIDESLEKAKGEIQNAVDDTKATADRMNKELAKVQEDLTKISEEAVYNAQKQIDNAVSDFNGFVTSLENAISKGEWDDTMFEGAFNELTKSEQDLVDAITQLQQSSQDTEAQNAITILGGQLTGIRSLKSSLRAAIDAKDMNAARGVLNAAREMSSLYNSRAAVSKVNNSIKSLKSKASVLGVLAKAALSTMSEQDDFEASIGKLREAFSSMFITAMDNFHQMNAYLGSTNSMAYVIKRESANDLSDFTIDELERWVRISAPDKIDDAYGFGASQFGGRRWNFVYDNLASTYMTWAWPLIDLDGDTVSSKYKFMQHFNLSGLVNNYKGFDEEYSELEGNPETNWVARGITAPKNWADGTTVVVTNGKFSVKAASSLTNEVEVVTNVLMTVESPAQYGQEGRVTVTLQTMKIKYLTGEPASEKKKINSLQFGSWRGAVFHGDSLTVDSVSAGGATTNVSQISVSEKHDGYDDAISNDDFQHYPQKTNFICQSHSEGINGTWLYEWIDITGGHIGSNTCATCGGGYSDLTWRHCKYESPSSFQITDGEYILTCEKCGEVVRSPRMAGMRYLDEEYHAEYCFFDYNGVAIRCTPAKNLGRHEFPKNPEPGMERYCFKCDTICPENTDYIIIDNNVDPYEFDGGSSDWPSGAKKVIFY